MLVIVWAFAHSCGTGCVSGVEGLGLLHSRWTMLEEEEKEWYVGPNNRPKQ
jgi:hypothetical protein